MEMIMATAGDFERIGVFCREVIARIGMKAVRLDALSFKKRGVQNWYASNTGPIDLYLFEYLL